MFNNYLVKLLNCLCAFGSTAVITKTREITEPLLVTQTFSKAKDFGKFKAIQKRCMFIFEVFNLFCCFSVQICLGPTPRMVFV